MVPQEQNLQKKCKMVPRELPPFRPMCHNEGHMLNAYHRSPNRPMPGGWIVVRSGPSASGACGKRASVLECGGPPPLWPAPNCKRTLRKPWGSFIFHSSFSIFPLKKPMAVRKDPASDPVSPSQTFEILKNARHGKNYPVAPAAKTNAHEYTHKMRQQLSVPLKPVFHFSFFILHLKIGGFKVIQGYSRWNFFSS